LPPLLRWRYDFKPEKTGFARGGVGSYMRLYLSRAMGGGGGNNASPRMSAAIPGGGTRFFRGANPQESLRSSWGWGKQRERNTHLDPPRSERADPGGSATTRPELASTLAANSQSSRPHQWTCPRSNSSFAAHGRVKTTPSHHDRAPDADDCPLNERLEKSGPACRARPARRSKRFPTPRALPVVAVI